MEVFYNRIKYRLIALTFVETRNQAVSVNVRRSLPTK